MVKLNLGCGKFPITLPNWINIDQTKLSTVDLVFDLENCEKEQLPFEESSIDEFFMSHVLEHIKNILPLMQELHRVAKPNALLTVKVPYGSSDDAFEDPTHIRQMFIGSFGFFSQPYYWRADYGYKGDWKVNKVFLYLYKNIEENLTMDQLFNKINSQRNVVKEMLVELLAVKPIREPLKNLQTIPQIFILRED